MRRVTVRKVAQVLSGFVIAVACVTACTNEVAGTPRAAPGQSTTTTSPTTTSPTTTSPSASPSPGPGSTRPSAPSVPSVPTRTGAPAPPGAPAGVDTTCDEYIALDEDAQRAVIDAIAEENELVALSPEMWVTVAGALCTFADPATPVREVLEGQGIR